MIIWLASYPKSGNTWIRSFLYTLLYSNNKEPDLDKIGVIDQYPLKRNFTKLTRNFNNFKEISNNWITSQEILNSDKKIKFLKTHHIFCEYFGNKFTNLNNTLGVIHIVRDPRNVITSIKNHYSKDTYEKAYDFITDNLHCIDTENISHSNINKKDILDTLISSWANHYNSWKKFPKNYLLVKYEDLIQNPYDSFKKITNYLKKLININFSEKEINKAIESNSFLNLKKIEERDGFKEKSINLNKNELNNFFYLGPKNKWQNLLPMAIKDKLEEAFFKEMKELNYINE
jgi:hypothetical protein